MFLPSTIFGHMAYHCNHVVSSPDENNNIKMVYIYKQEAHGPQFAHLSKTAIAYLLMPFNILPVKPLGHKFGRVIKKFKVILGSPFEQT